MAKAKTDIKQEKSAYDQRVKEFRDERKEFEKRSKDEDNHTLESFDSIGDVTRFGLYRENGYFYIKNKESRKKKYDSPSSEGLKQAISTAQGGVPLGGKEHRERYKYDYQKPSGEYNYLTNGKVPYANEAHHLIPEGSFAEPFFTDDQIDLLLRLPYHLNHGQNIIFLPYWDKDMVIHDLPSHGENLAGHVDYNGMVGNDISQLSCFLDECKHKPCNPDDPPGIDVVDSLIRWEDEYWKFLVKKGKGNVNERAKAAMKTSVV